MEIPSVFVINLKRSPKRKLEISQHLSEKCVPFEIIEAIDGRLLTDQEIKHIYCKKTSIQIMHRELARNEIACAMSHIKVYKKIVKDKLSGAVILEDDIEVVNHFAEIIKHLHLKIEAPTEHIILFNHNKYYVPSLKQTIYNDYNLYPIKPLWSHAITACGYYVSYAAAQKLIDYHAKIWHAIDLWDFFVRKNIIKLSFIAPYCVQQKHGIDSDIGLTKQEAKPLKKPKEPKLQWAMKHMCKILVLLRLIRKQPKP